MNKSYRVFTGAPPPVLNRKFNVLSWKTLSSREFSPPLPPMTIEQAGHRISLVYQNVIFEDDEEENQDKSEEWQSQNAIEISLINATEFSKRSVRSNVDLNYSETYDMDHTGDEMTMLSEGSSISHFPTFNFSLNTVSSLSSIMNAHKPGYTSSKVTFLLGVLEVEGPSYVKVKTGHYAGSEVALLKLIVGDETGVLCKIVAWRDTAEMWGGVDIDPGLKRGDIVLFENVMVSGLPRRHGAFEDTDVKLQITASPNLKSHAQICYRTLPETYEDRKLRPDLRLADTIPPVRRISEIVSWMERMAGITPKP